MRNLFVLSLFGFCLVHPFITSAQKNAVLPIKKNNLWGLADTLGKVLVEPVFGFLGSFKHGKAVIGQNGKKGWVDAAGRVLVPPKYDAVKQLNFNFTALYLAGKTGICDSLGHQVLPAEYDRVELFGKNFLRAEKNGQPQLFSYKNGKTFPLDFSGGNLAGSYDKVELFQDAFLMLFSGKKIGIADLNGNVFFEPVFSAFGSYSPKEKRLQVFNGKCYGYVDLEGRELMPPQFLTVNFIDSIGLAIVTDSLGMMGLYKTSEGYIIDPRFKNIEIRRNVAVCELPKGNKEVFDFAGKQLVPYGFSRLHFLDNGYAVGGKGKLSRLLLPDFTETSLPVLSEYKFLPGTPPSSGYLMARPPGVTKFALYSFDDDSLLCPPLYDNFSFSEDYIFPETGGHQGLMDKEGNLLIPAGQYGKIVFSKNNLIYAQAPGGLWAIYNGKGKMLHAPSFNTVFSFYEGLNITKIEQNGKFGLIDNRGRLALKPAHESLDLYENKAEFQKGKSLTVYEFNKAGAITDVAVFNNFMRLTIGGGSRALDLEANSGNAGQYRWRRNATGLWELDDANWAKIIEQEFDGVYTVASLNLSVANTLSNGMISVVDLSEGKILYAIKAASLFLNDYSEASVARFAFNDNFGGFVNKQGETITDFPCKGSNMPIQESGEFLNGSAWVKAGGKYGYASTDGKAICPASFDQVSPFSPSGIGIVQIGSKFGALGPDGKEKIPAVYDMLKNDPNSGLVLAELGGKWGVLDAKGRIACAPAYDFLSGFGDLNLFFADSTQKKIDIRAFADFNNDVSFVKSGGKWGVLEKSGKVLLEPKYTSASYFWNGVATLGENGKFGWFCNTNNFLQNPVYDAVSQFGPNGTGWVKKGGKWALAKTDGTLLTPFEFDEAFLFNDGGFAVARKGQFYGCIKPDGSLAQPFSFDFIDSFSFDPLQGYPFAAGATDRPHYFIKKNGKTGFIDGKGTILIAPAFDCDNAYIDSGLVHLLKEEKKNEKGEPEGYVYRGFGDMSGKTIVPPVYTKLKGFENIYKQKKGIVPAEIGARHGYLNHDGTPAIPLKYRYINHFTKSDTAAEAFDLPVIAVNSKRKSALMDRRGAAKTPFEYDKIEILPQSGNRLLITYINQKTMIFIDSFGNLLSELKADEIGIISDGMLKFRRDSLWGYADKNGRVQIEPAFKKAENFVGGTAKVCKKGKWGLIGRDGQWRLQPVYEELGEIRGGALWGLQNSLYAMFSLTGQILIPAMAISKPVWDKKQDHAIVRLKSKTGLAVPSGVLLPTDFSIINTEFLQGFFYAKKYGDKKSLTNLYSSSGKQIFDYDFSEIAKTSYGYGIFMVKSAEKKSKKRRYGLASIDGRLLLPCKYKSTEKLKNDVLKNEKELSFSLKTLSDSLETAAKNTQKKNILPDSTEINRNKGLFSSPELVDADGFAYFNPAGGLAESRTAKHYDSATVFAQGLALVLEGEVWETRKKEASGNTSRFRHSRETAAQTLKNLANMPPKRRKAYSVHLRKPGEWSLIDRETVSLMTFKHLKNVQGFNEGIAILESYRKIGLIDAAGNQILPPVYDDIRPAGNGLFRVSKADAVGYIRDDGSWVYRMGL